MTEPAPPTAPDGRPPTGPAALPPVDVGPLAKLADRQMAELADHTPLTDDGKPLLDPAQSARDLIARLVEEKLWIDAVSVLAHAMPKREAVWWGALIARQALPEPPDRKELMTLEAAEAWVRKPSEEARQVALARGGAIRDTNAPSAWAAVAAGWATGSMVPKSEIDVPAQPWMTGTAVFSAVMRGAMAEPERALVRLRAALVCGLDIADGGNGQSTPLSDTGPGAAGHGEGPSP